MRKKNNNTASKKSQNSVDTRANCRWSAWQVSRQRKSRVLEYMFGWCDTYSCQYRHFWQYARPRGPTRALQGPTRAVGIPEHKVTKNMNTLFKHSRNSNKHTHALRGCQKSAWQVSRHRKSVDLEYMFGRCDTYRCQYRHFCYGLKGPTRAVEIPEHKVAKNTNTSQVYDWSSLSIQTLLQICPLQKAH